MATLGNIIAATTDGITVNLSVAVAGDDQLGAIEYQIQFPRNHADGTPKTMAEMKAEASVLLKALRARRVPPQAVALSGTIPAD